MTNKSLLRGEAAVYAEAKCGGCMPSTSVKSVSDTLDRLTATDLNCLFLPLFSGTITTEEL